MSISKLLPPKLKNYWRLPGLDEKGQSIIIIAFAILGMIAMLGLALDVGLVYIERTRIKRAVDAAVLAGVVELPSEEQSYLRAIAYLDENGYRLRDGNGNSQINVYIRGCAHDGYLRTTNYGDYHDSNNPGGRESIVRDDDTYYLYFPSTGGAVGDPKAEFFIDTRTFQSRDSAGDPLDDDEQCDGNTLLGTANKIHMDGIIPVRMNFMQFFGFREVPVWDEAVAENVTNLDVAVIFDISGSMQFDTTCYGCYEPYRDGTYDWEDMSTVGNPDYDPDFSINYPNPAYVNPIPVDHLPTTYLDGSAMSLSYGFAAGNSDLPDPPTPQNTESLCADRDGNLVDYKTTVGGSDPVRFVIVEAELYSLNTSLLAGPFRQPGRGFWAIQHTDWRTVLRMEGATWDPDSSYGTGATPILPTASYANYERSSWVSHHPYSSWALDPPLSIPFGHDYTLAEVQATPNDVPSLEYDFIISSNPATVPWQDDGDTRIWARVQDGGGFGYDESFNHNSNIYWALYDYSELQSMGLGNDNPADDAQPVNGSIEVATDTPDPPGGNRGANYGGADDNKWDWIRLTGAGLDLPDADTKKYTLKIWAGGAGYDIDQIVIGNTNDTSFTTNYSGGTPAKYSTSSYATPGSAFRQACNHCNPIYGLLINDKNQCTPTKDNGWSIISDDGTDNGDPLQERLFGGYQPLRDAKEATKRFIARLDPQFDQVGVASYSTRAPADGRMELRCRRYYNADQCFQGSTPISYTEVLDVLERVPPNGSTNMAEGMLRGLEMLGINGNNVAAGTWTAASNCDSATDHCSRGGSARRIMIVLTDGVANKNPRNGGVATENCYATDLYQPNVGDDGDGANSEDRAKDCSYFYAQKAAANNVTIYTIGLGNGVDTNFLDVIAKLPGSDGEFFQAVTSSQLDEIFETILGSVSVRLIQ